MWGFSTAWVCLLVSLGFGSASMVQTSPKPAPRVIDLTPKVNEKEIKVRVGDELVVKLPMQTPFAWGMTEENIALKEIKTPIKVVPIDQPDQNDQVVGTATISALRYTVVAMPKTRSCKCGSALAHAILTERDKIPAATKEKLKLIVGKYL